MAKRDKNLVGLDIDPGGITAAEVTVNGRIAIERAAFAPLEAGIVRDGEVDDPEALAEALRSLFRTHKGFGKRVRVGVANQKIVVRVVDAPPITDPRELDAAMQFQVQDELPMPLENAVFDYHPLELVTTEAGRRHRVLLVAARRDMVERVLSAVRSAGLRPEGVDLSAFAMVRALHRSAPGDEQSLYLSIGGLTNLAVARGRTCLFTRASGGGLEAMAVELAERKGLTLEHARAWLAHVGVAQPVEAIEGDAGIVADARAVLLDGIRRIAAEVRNSFDQPRAARAEQTSPSPSPRGSQPPPTGAGTGAAPTGGTASTAPAPTTKPRGGSTNPPKPAPDGDPLDTHHLTIRFGRADGQMKTYKDVARLSPLPTADNPFFVFTGVLKDAKTAVFLLSSDATATGDGHCKPSPKSCQTIEVQQGDTEFFDLTVDGQPVQYQLDVVRVFRKGAKSAAANERHSVAGAAMLRSAHVDGSSAFKDAAAYRWLPDRGVLVRTPKHGGGRASANGGSAASGADAAAPLPGQPVWHWRLGG